MESEVKGEGEREARSQVTPEIHIVPGLPQEESIFHNMQYNHEPDSDRRRLSLENLPGLYNMSCTQLLAQAHAIGTNSSVGAASTPSYAADSQISKDSWANSWKMESNPWILTPGSSHGTKTGIVGEGTMEKPQYEEPHDPIDKSFHETGSPAGERERKRGRDESDDDIAPLKTPQPRQKRKKIRGKVAGDVNTSKSASKSAFKKASATAPSAITSEVNTYVRPKRSCKRSLTFNSDAHEEDGYSGLTFTSEDRIGTSSGGKIVQDATMRIFGNIPRRKRKTRTRSKEQTLEEDPKGRNMRTNDQTLTGKKSFWLRLSNIQRKRRSIIVQRRRHRQLKDIVSKMQSGVSRNKRSNRDPIASKLNARVLHLQWRRHNSTGTSPEEIWEQRLSIDSIIKLFNELDVTRDSPCFPQNRETTLVLHQKTYQKQKAAVQYRSDGSIIPYPDEKNHQTKVELDEETMRVWKLLMLSIDNEGIDGLEEDNQKWWEEERKLFHERANLFIARMRLVQGDRRFSHWKGSIVDSVVGVFLTQNVADHSSSSAFMDIAAEFPIISKSNKESYHEEWGSSITDEIVMNLDPGNAATTPGICNPTIFVDEIDDDDDIDAVCSQETSTSSDKSINSTNHSKTGLLDSLTNIFKANFDDSRNNVDEGTRVEHMGDHQQQKPNTKTDQQDMKNRKNRKKPSTLSPKNRLAKNKPKESFDWDSLRRQAEIGGQKRQRTERTMDTVDWDALRCTNVNKIADIIRRRGMNNMLSHRIKAFLNRLVQDHEEIDLEWLRDVPPDKAKEYLMSINGLGLKSAECVRLLSLHQIAFPVDTNVGRIAVRLGWVPLQPLPDELQMHLLELYPILASVQKYLWPRLCKLDQKTLYELHYHMITFGKVFCTKVKPNCEACPMKAECRHYASARASALRALPEPEERGTVTIHQKRSNPNPVIVNFQQSLFLAQDKEQEESKRSQGCEPIIEEPATPEIVCADIEDFPDPWENKDSIPTIILNKEANISKDLVVLSIQAASITRPKLKFIEKLRTEHYVYELPDTHHILEGFEKRELEDRVPYLLAIWTSGETASSIQPPKLRCASKESNILCHEKTCFSCNNIREENSQIVRGTVLIPCRTAMRGGFPLNGTYFQTNEVFADHGSSINPIDVPRNSIGGLRRRIVYFGSSVSACFGGLSVEAIQYGFWTGYVCVRGFDRKSRKPKALVKRLHCPPSKKKKDEY